VHALQAGGLERVMGRDFQGGGGRGVCIASAGLDLDLLLMKNIPDKANTPNTPNATKPSHTPLSPPFYAL